MKIVIAPDKFKHSMTAIDFCRIVQCEMKRLNQNLDVFSFPLADGGDGTIEVANYYLQGELISLEVNNPFFQPVKASYLFSESTETAFIEMAEASGVKLLDPQELDCKNATTLGTGEMIVDAINRGATNIILGIGGSATNDCGIGMATALGYQFLDEENKTVRPIGANLSKIKAIDVAQVTPKLFNVNFEIACDVTNPLYGENGAAYVYAAQKGASATDIEMLDLGLRDFSKILQAVFQVEPQLVKGAGAAGGMGIASKVFLNGNLKSGVQLIKDLANFDSELHGADWVITGEGKLDEQTLSGKTIEGVLRSAKAQNVKVAAFCGAVTLDKQAIQTFGIDYVDAVDNYASCKDDAMHNGAKYLKKIAANFLENI
ncbi:glycerate kinase [Tamlana fucoidanivorans]|uniref:Glycerate kinase n=1 Tax=Allotamlana fucoidanivorans TaxID=2583814 RepID=A0A5C4SLQ5_9FLAO|nr:glycerate kinase [Tamlana fucoidanivorans]TNJ44212.1 glycerate kinase [Tamlana fucoidanivorans]